MGPKFPKSTRLKRQEDFESVRRKGERRKAGALVLMHKPAKAQRIGITISKRVGNAVERNRIRRVVRDFFRRNRDLFPAGDLVVLAMAGLANQTNDGIRRLLKEAAEKF